MIRGPYPGLRPFEREEPHLFFGRDEQVDQLLDKLDETHFLAVLGTSGSGKSSLVRAGLLPALETGYLASAGAHWAVAALRPGDRPFGRLAESLIRDTDWGGALAAATPDPDPGEAKGQTAAESLELQLRSGSLALNWRLGVEPLPAGNRLLILVDQFEELFRYRPAGAPGADRDKDQDAAAFVALLLGAATHPAVYVVVTLRSEFLGDCSRFPDLPEAINRGLFLVPSLSPEQMADAIQLPAELPQFGGAVDPDLVRRLLDEARGQTDQLPLLQHALMRLWDRARVSGPGPDPDGDPKRLRSEDLDAIGGFARCLDLHAEEAFAELGEGSGAQRIAETLFRALIEIGPGERFTRRPVPLAEIADLTGADWSQIVSVVETFRQPGRSFLTPSAGSELKPADLLDISHEALIRQWRRLCDWTANESEQAELYGRLESAARRHRADRGALWIDPDLQIALNWREERRPTAAWARRYGGDFALAKGFLDASLEKRERDADHAQHQRLERTRELFDSRLTHARLLARMEDYAEARTVLRQTVALDPDIPEHWRHTRNLLAGYMDIVSGSADRVYAGAGAALTGGVAASLDGRWLVAAGERGTLVLFDAQSGEPVRRLEGHDPKAPDFGAVRSVVFDPEGLGLYSGGSDGRIIRWSIPDGSKIAEWKTPDRVCALALSPDGKRLASSGTDKTIALLSAETGEILLTLEGHTDSIAPRNGLDFTCDGKRLASASYDKSARIWDLETGGCLHILQGYNEPFTGVAFGPDGKLIATASSDRRIVIWDSETGQPLRSLVGHTNMVLGIAFDSDGRRLLSASLDNTLRLWDVPTGVALRVYHGHTAALLAVVRRGETLYTASNDQTIRRWPLETPGLWVWELDEGASSVAVSPDAGLIALGLESGALRIYDRACEALAAESEHAHGDTISRLAFNADATLLASAGMDGKAKLWRIAREPGRSSLILLHALEGHKGSVHAVAFSPDGLRLATASYDGYVGLFDTETGDGELFQAHDQCKPAGCAAVQFSADGAWLMSVGYAERRVKRWNLGKRPPEPRVLAQAQDMLLWATLSADDRQLAAVGRECVVALHELAAEPSTAEQRWLAGHEQSILRAIYSPDGRQLATVSWDMTVRLWDLATEKQLFALRLPTEFGNPGPLWDFDFRCTAQGDCWIAVPLTIGRLVLYRLPYLNPPESIR